MHAYVLRYCANNDGHVVSTIEIDTTQNVSIRFQAANVLERILARVIDVTVLTTFLYACIIPLSIVGYAEDENYWLFITVAVVASAIAFLYSFIMESIFHGQTIGKMAMNIRVVRADGTEPSVGNYAVRFLIGVFEVSMTFGSLATIVVLVSKTNQRLGDMAANTLVIKKPRRVTLAQVGLMAEVNERTIQYHGAANLSPSDVKVLRDVLLEVKRNHLRLEAVQILLDATRVRIESVIGEPLHDGTATAVALHDVLEDYNSIHGYQR